MQMRSQIMKNSNVSSFPEVLKIHKLTNNLSNSCFHIKSLTAAFSFLAKAINSMPFRDSLPYSPAYCHKHKILKH